MRQCLVEDHHPALEADAQGFRSLDLADHLEHFSGVELATLFCGEQYVDVDSLIQCFEFDDEQQDTAATKSYLDIFVRSMSESSIRVCKSHQSAVSPHDWSAHHSGGQTRPRAADAVSHRLSYAAAAVRLL